MLRSVVVFVICFGCAVAFAAPLKFFVQDKNIFLNKEDKVIQVTNQGSDRALVLSPDYKHVAFIRKSKRVADDLPAAWEQNEKQSYADEIWIIDVNQEMKPRLLLSHKTKAPGNEPKGKESIGVVCFDKMAFSPDSKKLYFLTSAWETSCAVNVVNIDGQGEKYVTDARSLTVIQKGEYKGNLLVGKHKYFIGPGGSYDWVWMVSPNGEEIGPVEEDEKAVDLEVLESYPEK